MAFPQFGPPLIDFSPISKYGSTFFDAFKEGRSERDQAKAPALILDYLEAKQREEQAAIPLSQAGGRGQVATQEPSGVPATMAKPTNNARDYIDRTFASMDQAGSVTGANPAGQPRTTFQNPQGDPTRIAYEFFVPRYGPAGAAGIVGNLMAESNLNTGAINRGDGRDGSNSIGIAQWNGPRARAFQEFAGRNRLNPSLLDTQLKFVQHELDTTEAGTGQALGGVRDPRSAAMAFTGYERPAGWTASNPAGAHSAPQRVAGAERIFSQFGGGGQAAPAQAPVQTAQAGGAAPAQAQGGLSPMMRQKLGALLSNEHTRDWAAKNLLPRLLGDKYTYQVVGDNLVRIDQKGNVGIVPGLNAQKPTEAQLNYKAGVQDPGFARREEALKRAGAIQNNLPGEPGPDAVLRKELSQSEGKRFSQLQEAGSKAGALTQDLQMLDELMTMAPQGPIVGRLAEAFPGYSAAGDAAQSIMLRLAPSLREPGSGSVDQIEYQGMLNSIPRLSKHPQGNQIISSGMKAKAAIALERAQVVTDYQNQTIDGPTARNRLAALNSRSIMTPQVKGLIDSLQLKEGEGEGKKAGSVDIPPEAARILLSRPDTPKERAKFDRWFGEGAAARIRGKPDGK